ncbi:MAG: Si-specific NAD(P)(+) transhydrogenase [Actinomycetota bacterium]|nr:Si-specific NAD(P)(+) transhydrogenase [Actinomycetota bacterium]
MSAVDSTDNGYDYDLLVIGSGPAGQKAAVQAAKLGRRVAVVERQQLGGASVNRGTIPSKTLREAIVYLTGLSQRAIYGDSYRVQSEITVDDLRLRTRQVIDREVDVVRHQLVRNHVEVIEGSASFLDSHTIAVARPEQRRLTAENVVIATGTRPAHPPAVEFDDRTILDSDGLLRLDRIPSSVVVVGAGVIGIEYASMFAALGAKVTVVEKRARLLDFCDGQISEGLQYHLRDLGVVFRLGEEVTAVDLRDGGAVTHLASGKRVAADVVLYAAGRQGQIDDLDLGSVGLEADERGRIPVDPDYRTAVEHIYAAGDVIGWPALAATSMEQGRLAAAHAFGVEGASMEILPIGIYTIPEISYVGRTEEELTDAAVPYEVGISRYRELARGQILGDTYGMLKLLVSPDDGRILGVHVLGTNATEVVHIGQAVMGFEGTVDYFIDAVFNYPTLAESYKVAALDAKNKLLTIERLAR